MAIDTFERSVELLIQAHTESEQDIIEIYLAPDDEEIRLIEVAETVGTTNEILPFSFDRSPERGINFPLSIVMVSAEEMQSIFDGRLELPEGWGTPDRLRRIFPRV